MTGRADGHVNEELQLNDPQTLYRRWEDSQWSPFTIDLTTDKGQWPQLPGAQRELLLFAFSSLMVAEERMERSSRVSSARTAARRKPPSSQPNRSMKLATCSSTPASKTR